MYFYVRYYFTRIYYLIHGPSHNFIFSGDKGAEKLVPRNLGGVFVWLKNVPKFRLFHFPNFITSKKCRSETPYHNGILYYWIRYSLRVEKSRKIFFFSFFELVRNTAQRAAQKPLHGLDETSSFLAWYDYLLVGDSTLYLFHNSKILALLLVFFFHAFSFQRKR